MKKKLPWAHRAYQYTLVDWAYTQDSIINLLQEVGIREYRFSREGNDVVLELLVKLYTDEKMRHVKIVAPYTPLLGETTKQRKRALDRIYRILFYKIRDRFISITSNVNTFDEAFMPDIMVDDGTGRKQRMADIILPAMKKRMKLGTADIRLLTE